MFFMPLADLIIWLLIGGVIVVIFGFIVVSVAKQQNAYISSFLSELTDSQKAVMMEASKNNPALTKAIISSEPKVGMSKTRCRLVFYDLYFPNSKKQFSIADVSFPTTQYEQAGLSVGDFVTLQLSADNVKVIF